MINGAKVLDHSIRWAMVGGGKGSQIGYIHRSAAQRDGNFNLVAGAFDINPERGIEFGKELGVAPDRCYPDYQTMFAEEAKRGDDRIEAVSIATPNSTHYAISKAALEAGFHVVCEKPVCFTSKEAEELVAIAREKNLVVGVTYGYSGHQMIQQARQMIKNGDLGPIRLINMSFAFGGYNTKIEETNAAARWRFDPSKAGISFAMGDVGTHPIFIIEAMIPDMKIREVLCTKQAFVEGRQLEDNAFTIMNLDGSRNVQDGAQVYCWSSSINCGARHGHKNPILSAIKAGKPVFTEKPLTTTAADCKEIVDAEMASGKHLVQVGFMRRYDRGYNQVRDLIRSGEFGRPMILKCTHRAEAVDASYTTEMAVTDTAIHEIDVLPWLIGEGEEWDEVQCLFPRVTKNAHEGLADPQVMIMKTKSGVVVVLEVNVNCGFGYDINCEVVCEDGVINLPCPSFPTTRKNFEVATAIEKNWILRFIDSYDVELQDWVDCVAKGTTGGSSAWDGYVAALTADALVAAQKSGKIEKVVTGGTPDFYKK